MEQLKELDVKATRPILDSELAGLLRNILPESLKDGLRKIIHGEKACYPLADPYSLEVGGISALFNIETHSDWWRIVSGSENLFVESFLEVVGDGSVVADIGSAQGLFTLPATKKGARVFAFDPDPFMVKALEENIKLNPETEENITIAPVALGDTSQAVTFRIDPNRRHAGSAKNSIGGLTQEIQVQQTTYDQYFESQNVWPDVVKIDVEGAEGFVLDGMKNALVSSHCPQHIFLELHIRYLPKFGTTPEAVLQKLFEAGYKVVGKPQKRGGEVHFHFAK